MLKLRRPDLHLFYWTTRLVILFVFPAYISDVGIYQVDMGRLLDGGFWPYRDFSFEYPPLTFLLLVIPAYLQRALSLSATDGYRLFLGLEMLPFDFLIFLGFLRRPPIPRAAFYYIGLTCLLPFLLFDRMDLVVAGCLAIPFLYAKEGGTPGFLAGWGIGGAFKLIPTLFLPFRLLTEPGGWARRIRLGLMGTFPVLVSIVLVLWFSEGGVSFLTYHGARGVQVESLLGNMALVGQSFGVLPQVGVETSFRSQQVSGLPSLILMAKLIFWAVFAGSYAVLAYKIVKNQIRLIGATWLLLLGMITFSYVLSPQYLFWLIPLALLVTPEMKRNYRATFLYLMFLVTLMTGLHFCYYWSYANRHFASLLFLGARNLMMVGLWAASWVWIGGFWREGPLPAAREGRFD